GENRIAYEAHLPILFELGGVFERCAREEVDRGSVRKKNSERLLRSVSYLMDVLLHGVRFYKGRLHGIADNAVIQERGGSHEQGRDGRRHVPGPDTTGAFAQGAVLQPLAIGQLLLELVPYRIFNGVQIIGRNRAIDVLSEHLVPLIDQLYFFWRALPVQVSLQ